MRLNKNKKLVWEGIINKLNDNEKMIVKMQRKREVWGDLQHILEVFGLLSMVVWGVFAFSSLDETGTKDFARDSLWIVCFGALLYMSGVIINLIILFKFDNEIDKLSKTILGVS